MSLEFVSSLLHRKCILKTARAVILIIEEALLNNFSQSVESMVL